jgi:hypothetical protein
VLTLFSMHSVHIPHGQSLRRKPFLQDIRNQVYSSSSSLLSSNSLAPKEVQSYQLEATFGMHWISLIPRSSTSCPRPGWKSEPSRDSPSEQPSSMLIVFKITHPWCVSPLLVDCIIDEKDLALMKVLKGLAFYRNKNFCHSPSIVSLSK